MFKVYHSVFSDSAIDNVLACHEGFKRSRVSFFRAQGTTAFEKPKLDGYGNQRNSIQNPHLLGFSPALAKSIQELLYSDSLYDCISSFSHSELFVHYQSMLFDKSTGTALHQDSWYLDTDPGGALFGVWIALEDISEEVGAFYLLKNGPDSRVSYKEFDFENILEDGKFKSQYPNAEVFKYLPKKGDMVVWDSNNLHGAFLPAKEGVTRKSITGHFYPYGTKVMKQPVKRLFSIYNHDKPKQTQNKKIMTAATINPWLYNLLCAVFFFMGKYSSILTRDKDNNADISQIRKI